MYIGNMDNVYMEQELEDEYYLLFPDVLREALINGIVELPDNLEKEYSTIIAYRAIRYYKGDKETPDRRDFLSQIELKSEGNVYYKRYSDDDIDNYAASVFSDKEELLVCLSLPRKNKAIAIGDVCCNIGAISRSDEDSHVLWFLYDHMNPESFFKVIEYYEKVDKGQEYRTVVLRENTC